MGRGFRGFRGDEVNGRRGGGSRGRGGARWWRDNEGRREKREKRDYGFQRRANEGGGVFVVVKF